MVTKPVQVVVAYDFSRTGRAALERAVRVANRAPFHVLHVVCAIGPREVVPDVPREGPVDYRYAERVQTELGAVVERVLREQRTDQPIHFFTHARIGKAADEILGVAEDVGAELILVGSHGMTGLRHVLVGSVAEHVVRNARCTVEVIRDNGYPHVDLVEVVEVEPSHHYVPPHRYHYDDNRVITRPAEWPLL